MCLGPSVVSLYGSNAHQKFKTATPSSNHMIKTTLASAFTDKTNMLIVFSSCSIVLLAFLIVLLLACICYQNKNSLKIKNRIFSNNTTCRNNHVVQQNNAKDVICKPEMDCFEKLCLHMRNEFQKIWKPSSTMDTISISSNDDDMSFMSVNKPNLLSNGGLSRLHGDATSPALRAISLPSTKKSTQVSLKQNSFDREFYDKRHVIIYSCFNALTFL